VFWVGLPRLCVVLAGGFTTNFIWCLLLNRRNGTGYQYLASHLKAEPSLQRSNLTAALAPAPQADLKIPVLANYLFCALAGTLWYFQFFFYSMGETQMGKFSFASWTLHMASIIIFSTMWGWILHEWKGSSKKTHLLIAAGIATLILSTCVIGAGAGWTNLMAFIHHTL
jgi:L-rhamnose-H+ transport protein